MRFTLFYRTKHPKTAKLSGLTAVEFIAVIILVAVLSAFAIVRWPGRNITVDAVAEQLAQDIRFMQSYAMQRGIRTRINFSSSQYELVDITGATPIAQPAIGSNIVTLPNNINLFSTNPLVVFDSLGRPYSDAVVPGTQLVSNLILVLTTNDGFSRQLVIIPDTGKVIRL
ncbi:MAG: hypothetical protein Tsb005_11110 [Gammaproteobacteria bacterium]